jgi:hypothetical protein
MGKRLNMEDVDKLIKDDRLYKDVGEALAREIKKRDDKLRGEMFLPLDIDNLPDKFFTREDIEIEVYYTGDWGYKENRNKWIKNADSKTEVVRLILETTNLKYRYRIIDKKLKSIQITKEMADKEMRPHDAWSNKDHEHVLSGLLKREVIIIE